MDPIAPNQNQPEPQSAEQQPFQPEPTAQQPIQPQSQPQPQVQQSVGAQPSSMQGQTVDIEAMKREAQKRRQASEVKEVPQQEYKVFTKKYILAVSILLIAALAVFGLIIYFQMQRG